MDARLRYILIGIYFLILLNFSGCTDYLESARVNLDENNINNSLDNNATENISIACWNLQIFGQKKASNVTLLNFYSDILMNFDLFIIQEIRDSLGTAVEQLALYLPNHDYVISSRAGQSSSKEQYAIFYNQKIEPIKIIDYTDEYQSEANRPPFAMEFQSVNWTCTLITMHTDPDDVYNDLSLLEEIASSYENDVIVIGDLNADGSYYNEDDIHHFIDWHWIISNSIDTTVAVNDYTYDRIIFNKEAYNNYINFGVIDNIKKSQSDHYLVYCSINPNNP